MQLKGLNTFTKASSLWWKLAYTFDKDIDTILKCTSTVIAFQLCFDNANNQKLVTWNKTLTICNATNLWSHERLDQTYILFKVLTGKSCWLKTVVLILVCLMSVTLSRFDWKSCSHTNYATISEAGSHHCLVFSFWEK